MADQALFAYQAQLPDGSTIVRTGGADTAPTHQQLADYAANRGEVYLGPVAMSPNVQSGPPEEAAPPPAPTSPPAPAATVASPETFGERVYGTFAPARSLASQVPSMVGGFGGGALGGAAAGALGGPFAPITVPLGALAGAALGSGGLEYLQSKAEQEAGVPPSEQGTPGERAVRAGVRGLAGEGLAQGLTAGAQAVKAAAGPTLRAAESLAPTLTRELPPEATAATTKVGQLIRDPEALAAADLTPKGQQTVLSAWWNHYASQGADALGQAWDALGPQGQANLGGNNVDALGTLIKTIRPGELTASMRPTSLLKTAGLPAALWHHGMISQPTMYALGAGIEAARDLAPRALLYDTPLTWLAKLPQLSRVASPWAYPGAEAGGQLAATQLLPAYQP